MAEDLARTNADIALDFLQQVASGAVDDAILTADFSAWTAVHGDEPGSEWRKKLTALDAILIAPLRSTPVGVTAEGDRVAVEAISYGKLINGDEYSNHYHFLITVTDGRVAKVKCYFNTALAAAKLGPLLGRG